MAYSSKEIPLAEFFFVTWDRFLVFIDQRWLDEKWRVKWASTQENHSWINLFPSIYLIYKIYRKDFLSKTMNEIDDEILFISQFVLFFLIDAIVENNRNLHIFKPIILISKLEIAFWVNNFQTGFKIIKTRRCPFPRHLPLEKSLLRILEEILSIRVGGHRQRGPGL